jgi:hypothetical protein
MQKGCNGQIPHTYSAKGSFWWRDCLSYAQSYREHTTITINNVKSCLLWTNKRIEPNRDEEYPHLFSFAKDKSIPIDNAWNAQNDSLYDIFHLPLSTIAHEEFHSL